MGSVKEDMSTDNLLEALQSTLAAMPASDFLEATKDLLATLGYRSERTLPGQTGAVADFIAQFPAPKENTRTEQVFRENVRSVQFVFQLTDDEIASFDQPTLGFETASFDKGQQQSFIFFAVELKEATYARGQYAQFTREINKRLSQPTVVLFKTADNLLTLAFVHRREHKHDPERDVLGRVSLIREIDPANPHRAHLDILAELSLTECAKWMDIRNRPHNFDGLLAAWLDKLDTEELNRRFYQDLFVWFDRAVKEARFPTDQARTLPAEEHVIRLITRLLFVWFIKEKGLIVGDLFIEAQVADLLKNYDRDSGDSYYRAVLQNLFFATLNTEINKRGFSKAQNATHRNFSLYRYKREISNPDALLDLFAQTPFINGGLFDCLDSEEATGYGGWRIDCFSDVHYKNLSVPNHLFFDDDGLITLLNHYKFTVEENTPIEKEVALDPELLGKVFENLLAAYNPETRETARKQTGSYYTPRAVVDYMVDEAAVETLASKSRPADGDSASWRDRLHYLLDYEDAFDEANELFDEDETDGLVRAIAEIKILDPAVGSGAFPMGALHKLTLALRRLDPENKRWEGLQKELAGQRATAAFDTHNQRERDAELKEISETFERYRDSDFGRKLYLVQNSIFGVDIQPIACQIAKLRFFISLAIEQEPNGNKDDNFGIQPLPNLETRFVAANTLLGLGERMLSSEKVQGLEHKLHANRERHFHATNRQAKLRCRARDEELRDALAGELRQIGMPAAAADKIARWNPYDQNAKAEYFDAEYMFGVADGFDVVIGNPPYIQLQKNGGELGNLYKDTGYATFARTGDIYQLFYEKGVNLLKQRTGYVCFISSNQWMRVDSGRILRQFIENQNPIRLVNLGADVFDNATVNTCILIVNRSSNENVLQASDMRSATQQFPPTEWTRIRPKSGNTWIVLSGTKQCIKEKMEAVGTPLKNWSVKINRGIITGCNDAFIIDDAIKEALIGEDLNSADIIKPVLRGQDIQRYRVKWAGLWLINIPWHFPLHLDSAIKGSSSQAEDLFKGQYPAIYRHLLSHKSGLSSRSKSETGIRYEWYALQRWGANYHEDFAKEKIAWGNLSNQAKFSYAPQDMFVSAPTTILTPFNHYLLAALNSKLLDWYFRLIGVERDGGYYEYKPMFIERLPIPKIPATEQRPFIRLVDRILTAKATDPSVDTGEQEAEIDRLVYALYGLTEQEIALIGEKS